MVNVMRTQTEELNSGLEGVYVQTPQCGLHSHHTPAKILVLSLRRMMKDLEM